MTIRRSLRPPRPRFVAALALLSVAATGAACSSSRGHARSQTSMASTGSSSDLMLNRGDWIVGKQTGVWLATVPGPTNASAPERIGYVTSKLYREVRGGPTFTMYEVTGLDRTNVVGIVDTLGNAKRFKPGRDGQVVTEDAGNATLALSVQAIFETMKPVTLQKTTEHALAFEALDVNHDGKLDKDEFPRLRDKAHSPDLNKDGFVDLDEFERIDDL